MNRVDLGYKTFKRVVPGCIIIKDMCQISPEICNPPSIINSVERVSGSIFENLLNVSTIFKNLLVLFLRPQTLLLNNAQALVHLCVGLPNPKPKHSLVHLLTIVHA